VSFEAQYTGGECASCGTTIRKGEEVRFVAFDELVHVACPKSPLALQRTPCPRCFQEPAVDGSCGCD